MSLSKKGDTYLDFTVTKIYPLEELKCVLKELLHIPSGALIMHIENDDPENLFCLSFQTLPTNSNGVAHILEHTVLCGSKKFPVKDPFFSMTRRSLNTFMNALTGSDFTCYPAASQIETDFYNLLEVYLDAVFHPQLKYESFLQEGHRLEFTEDGKNLVFKGIVFNEMKGALSSADSRLWHAMMESLVPDLTYAHISGGDPKEIPSLTYEELKKFHHEYYHPSRCLFFFYGNLPLKKHLDFIHERLLKNIKTSKSKLVLKHQKRFKNPLSKKSFFPSSASDGGSHESDMIALGWLTTHIEDQEAVLALTVLDAVLMENDASCLKRAILDSGLCTSVDAYIDTEMVDVPYVIVCKGCHQSSGKQLSDLIKQTLTDIKERGIPFKDIESAVHQLELSKTEITTDHGPFGLNLFMRAALARQHGIPPERSLAVHTLFAQFLEKARHQAYLSELIEKFFLLNPHSVELTMIADEGLSSKEEKEEKERLSHVLKGLSSAEKETIRQEALLLSQYQKDQEEKSLESLPKIDLKDIPKSTKEFPLIHREGVFSHTCFTNHFIYADLVSDLPPISEEDLSDVHLLTLMIPELGAGNKDYDRQLEELQASTGGIGVFLNLNVQIQNNTLQHPVWVVRGKALERHGPTLFALMKEMATSFRVDEEERIKELLLQIHTALQNKLNKNAMKYALQLSLSGFSFPGKVTHLWNGLGFFKHIQTCMALISSGRLKELIRRFERIKESYFTFKNPRLVLSCDESQRLFLEKENYFDILTLPQTTHDVWSHGGDVEPSLSQARIISVPLGFTAKAYHVCSYTHPHAPALSLASHLMDNKILHKEIREQGGAYGAGSTYASTTGYFTFHAYRDPHLASTLKSFDRAIYLIANKEFSDQDLEEAKLGMIQQLDVPLSPGSRASVAYHWLQEGRTLSLRQRYRDQLLNLSKEQVAQAVECELLSQIKKGVVVSFAGKELLEKENKILSEFQNPLPIMQI